MREFEPVRIGDRNAHQIEKKDVITEDEIVSNFTYPKSHGERKAPAAAGIYIPMRYIEEKLGKSSGQDRDEILRMINLRSPKKDDNMRYLEMQYKFQFASKAFGTISNLMKVRHDAVSRSRGIR